MEGEMRKEDTYVNRQIDIVNENNNSMKEMECYDTY